MNEQEVRAVVQKLLEKILNTTYKDPMFVYHTNLLLAVVGKTLGLDSETVETVQKLMEEAKRTGKVDDKTVKSVFKAITKTEGPPQFLTGVVDEPHIIGTKATKLLEMMEIASYKGKHRNLPQGSKSGHVDTSLRKMNDYLSRKPDGVEGFVPSYQDLSVAMSMLENGYIAFQPYRKVLNEFDGTKKLNTSQSDLYVQGLEEFVSKNPEYQIFSFDGNIDKFPLTDDMFTQHTKILEYVFADDELIKKYAWKDLLDPAVIEDINKDSKNELAKLLEAEQNSGPKIDKFGQRMKNELHKWFKTIPKSWWGEPPKIISGGQSGIDSIALNTAESLNLNTGGFAPSGYTQKTQGENLEPYLGTRFGLEEIYKSSTGTPGTKADSAEIAKYIEKNATPELLEYFKQLDSIQGGDSLMDFSERWVSSKDVETSVVAGQSKKVTERKLNPATGNAAELAIRSQLNVNAADINIFFVDPRKINSVGTLKSINYSITGQWKYPRHIAINSSHGKKDMFGNKITGINVGEDWNVDTVADTLRQQNPDFKAGPDYWAKRAKKWIGNKKSQIGNLSLRLEKGIDFYLQGEEIPSYKSPKKKQIVQNHTIVVDVTNPDITDNLLAAIEAIQESEFGKGKVLLDVNGEPHSVDRINGQAELLEGQAKRFTINVGGHSRTTPAEKAHAERIIKAIVSPKGYFDFQNYQIHAHRSTGETKKVYSDVNLGIQDYRYEPTEDISKFVENIEGAGPRIKSYNPELFSEIDLINEGKVTSSVIDENKLLRQFKVKNVKQLVAILNSKPVIKLSNYGNYSEGGVKELYVEVAGFDKIEGYKIKKNNYKENLKNSLGGDLSRLRQKWELDKNTGDFKRGQIVGQDINKYITDLEHFTSPYSKGKEVVVPRTNWILNWRVVETTNPTVKRVQEIQNRFNAIRDIQELKLDYWSRGIDPTPINYIGKRKAAGEVHNLVVAKKKFVPAIQQLYTQLTSYDLGVRDFDIASIIKDLDMDIYKGETLQEIVNALLADPDGLANAVKEVNEVELSRASKENLLGKLSLFYKLMGRPNAVLQAIALNISKELSSLEYDQQGQRQLVSEAFQAIENAQDLMELNMEEIFNKAHGSHQQMLAIKTLEYFTALHAAELEFVEMYPELKNDLFGIRAIDIVDRDLDSMMDKDLELYQMTAGPVDPVQKQLDELSGISSEFAELMDSMNQSLKGLTKDEIVSLQDKIKEFNKLEATKKEIDIYQSRFESKQYLIDFAKQLTFYNNMSNRNKTLFFKTELEKRVKKALPTDSPLFELVKSLEDFVKNEPVAAKWNAEALDLIQQEIASPTPSVNRIRNNLKRFNTQLDMVSNRLGFDYLRIDNDFGMYYGTYSADGNEKKSSDFRKGELYAPGSAPKISRGYELLMIENFDMPLAHIFEDGFNNYMQSPDAIKALMLNDLNINPDKKDMFMKLFIQEYGTELFKEWNFESAPATLAALMAEQYYLSPDNLNEILKRLEIIAEGEELRLSDIDQDWIDSLEDRLRKGSQVPGSTDFRLGEADVEKALEYLAKEMFGKYLTDAELEKNQKFYQELWVSSVLQAIQRAVSDGENWKKVLDANKSNMELPNFNFKKLVKQMKGSQAYQLLHGDEVVKIPQAENVAYIKKVSELRLRGMINQLNDTHLIDSNYQFKLTSNIPDKWDMKVEQGKTFNPFNIRPSKGSDAFWHIELKRRPDRGAALDNKLLEAIDYILRVEQPTNYVNVTGSYLNADNNILKSGYLNSYLYADSLNDAIGFDYLRKQLNTEYEETLKNLDVLRQRSLMNADISDIFQINSTIDYLEMQVKKSYGLVHGELIHASRDAGAWQGAKSFYGLTDRGAYPLAKLKLNKADFTNENMMALNQIIIPSVLQSKSLDAIEYGQIEKSLRGKMPYEVTSYLETLSDLFEKKKGRHTLEKSIELSNSIFDDIFFDKKTGMLTPPDIDIKPINDYIQKVGETQFAYEYYKLQNGEEVSPKFKKLMEGTHEYKGLTKKLKNPHIWEKLAGYSGVQGITSGEYFKQVYDRYNDIKGEQLNTYIKPGEFSWDKYPELKSYFNMDLAVNFPLENLPNTLSDNFIYLTGDEVVQAVGNDTVDELLLNRRTAEQSKMRKYEGITSHLRERERTFLQDFYGISPDQLALPSGMSKAIVLRPKGYWEISPGVIQLGPGELPGQAIVQLPTGLPQVTETYGEGDPFKDARWTKRPRPVRNPREFIDKLIRTGKALSTLRYSPAKYDWNVLRTRGKENALSIIDSAPADRQLPPGQQSRTTKVRNYFRSRVYNARTLREMPFIYSTNQGKTGGRIHPWPYIEASVKPRARVGAVPTPAGTGLNVTPGLEYSYRKSKADFTAHVVGKSYHRATKAAILADVGHAVIGMHRWNDGTREYKEVMELTHTLPGRKAIETVFFPITFALERPFVLDAKAQKKKELAFEQYQDGMISQSEYDNKIKRYNLASSLNAPARKGSEVVGKLFGTLIQGVGDIGTQFRIAAMEADNINKSYDNLNQSQWKQQSQADMDKIAKARHLVYNEADTYYGSLQKFWSRRGIDGDMDDNIIEVNTNEEEEAEVLEQEFTGANYRYNNYLDY